VLSVFERAFSRSRLAKLSFGTSTAKPVTLFRWQIINMKDELVQRAGKIDWEFLNSEIAPLSRRAARESGSSS
jgi:hypothetical protein